MSKQAIKRNKKNVKDIEIEENVKINLKDQKKKKKTVDKKDNRILEVKTTQTGALKQVIERISNVISDCCIVFIPPDPIEDEENDENYYEEIEEDVKNKKESKTPKRNTGGIRILRLTEDKSILIKLNLDANNFEYFRCDEPKITIGVDMSNLHTLLKMVNDDDPIILYMNRDNRNVLNIRSINENNESAEETDIEIYLMEIANPELPIPQTEFQNHITISSDKFHTICKHLNNNSLYVEITSVNSEISFRGENENGKVTMLYKDVNYKKKSDKEQVVQGIYELRNLLGFSKCNKLCSTVEIYLRNDFPLVLVISVATLGKMYIFLTPIENANN